MGKGTLEGVSEGTWAVFAEKVVKERDTVIEENTDLRQRLELAERVVKAAQKARFVQALTNELSEALDAFRAYEAQKTPGSSRELPDAGDAQQATTQPEQRSDSSQDGGGNGPPREPTYTCCVCLRVSGFGPCSVCHRSTCQNCGPCDTEFGGGCVVSIAEKVQNMKMRTEESDE